MRATPRGLSIVLVAAVLAAAVLTAACSTSGDGTSSDELKPAISRAADEAVALLRAQTSALSRVDLGPGGSDTEDLYRLFRPYLDSLTAAGHVFAAAAADFDDADANIFIYVGLDLAILQVSRTPAEAGSTTLPSERSQVLDELLEAADEENARGFDYEEMADKAQALVRVLGFVAPLTDPGLVRQLLPPGSDSAARFAPWVRYDPQGNPTVTIPERARQEEDLIGPASWNDFVDAVRAERKERGPLGSAVFFIDREAEVFALPRRD